MELIEIRDYLINREQIAYFYRHNSGWVMVMSNNQRIEIDEEELKKVRRKREKAVQHKVHADGAMGKNE